MFLSPSFQPSPELAEGEILAWTQFELGGIQARCFLFLCTFVAKSTKSIWGELKLAIDQVHLNIYFHPAQTVIPLKTYFCFAGGEKYYNILTYPIVIIKNLRNYLKFENRCLYSP